MSDVRRCPKCKVEKPIAAFITRGGDPTLRYKRKAWCLPCRQAHSRAYYERRKQTARERWWEYGI